MIPKSRLSIAACAALAVFFGSATAVENCSDILKYASRDVQKTVSYADLRAFHYARVCSGFTENLGIDYKDAAFSLGLNYSTKEDYCNTESNISTNQNYLEHNSSIVISAAVDSYVQCRALATKGVEIFSTMPDNPEVFSIGVRRSLAEPVMVKSVTLDPKKVRCWHVGKAEKEVELKSNFSVINYALPESSSTTWNLSCQRKGVVNEIGTDFQPMQLLVDTDKGAFPLSLAGIGTASSVWASQIEFKLARAAPIGSIVAFAGTVIPAGWLVADGRELDAHEFRELFGVIGVQFSDSDTTEGKFALPDLRNRFIFGLERLPSAEGGGLISGPSIHMPPDNNRQFDHEVINRVPHGFVYDGLGVQEKGSQHHHEVQLPPFRSLYFIIRAK